MIRKRILLASLLKPATDTRLFEKIGKSLAKLPELEIHVAGYLAPLPPTEEAYGITFHTIFYFPRLSAQRLLAQIKYWRLLKELKPDLVVVATHELLFTTWLYCRQHKAKLVYDVQENYFLNLTTQNIYRHGLGNILGHTIRGIEKNIAPKVDHFFLAEESYINELPFLDSRFTVLQNKYIHPHGQKLMHRIMPVVLKNKNPLRLLYSGTISKLYGVLEAVKFISELRQWVPNAELTIAGYCADASFLKELQQQISKLPYIKLVGGSELLPHRQILELEQTHHIGLLPYQPHPSTFSCIPTKLFEYQANGLVIVAQENPLWETMITDNSSGLSLNFSMPVDQHFAYTLLNQQFYLKGAPQLVLWEQEEVVLQQVIRQLLT
ncbi:glycosyltransferase family protein [Rufibacter roseus]|uniref:Glycosyltransferase n=1 Tax=Rufibacter roseus TaxID=1567108 RepID=A0ABW2DS25_9BACT|nr:glycosyltransferase [Rufibacter roseus]